MSETPNPREWTDRELARLERRLKKLFREARLELDKQAKDYFAKFEKRDAEMLEKVKSGEITEAHYKQWRLNQIGRGERFETLRDEMARRYTDANEIAIAYLNKDVRNVYIQNRRFSIDGVIEDANGMLDGVDFALIDDRTISRLLVEEPDLMPNYPEKKALERGIDLEYGKKQIRKVVESGLLQGQSTQQMAAYLSRTLEKMEYKAAVRTVRTAFTAAENGAAQDADIELSKKGVILKKIWKCVHDGKTRQAHWDADGQTKDWDEPFVVGGDEMMFPGDKSMGAHGWNLYNCRCVRERKVVGFKSVLSDEMRKKANIRVTG